MMFGPEIAKKLGLVFPEFGWLWIKLGSLRVIVGLCSCIVLLFSLKTIWRLAWKTPILGTLLSNRIGPDLNGDWEVILESNFPVLEKLRNSAKGKRSFDIVADRTKIPELAVHRFDAEIDQSWENITIRFLPNSETSIKLSETLVCSFFTSTRPKKQGLTYVYRQENVEYGITDDEVFFGAAELEIAADGKTMTGYYWTKRQWQLGMNTAGKIRFIKK